MASAQPSGAVCGLKDSLSNLARFCLKIKKARGYSSVVEQLPSLLKDLKVSS